MSKTYQGPRTITAKFYPEVTRQTGRYDENHNWVEDGETYVSRGAHWVGSIDGQSYHGTNGQTEAEAIAAAGKVAAHMDIDAAIYPAAKAVAADLDGAVPAEGQTKDDFYVGQRVAVWSHNRRRVGLVEKVGKVNITVVVVVRSSGNLCRATSKFTDAVIVDHAAPEEPTEEAEADDATHHLAGLRTEQDKLQGRLVEAARSGQQRPELRARLDAVAARIAELIEAGVACLPTGRTGSDGRDCLACGSMANPAGFCCEHGTYVRTQPQGQPEPFDDDDSRLAQYDDDPSPYAGTYSEE